MVLPEVRQDFEKLLNTLLPFTQQMLQEHGDFLPFGTTLSPEGEGSLVMGSAGGGQTIPRDTISVLGEEKVSGTFLME